MDGAGDADADANLTHVPQTLGESRREAHHVILRNETETVSSQLFTAQNLKDNKERNEREYHT